SARNKLISHLDRDSILAGHLLGAATDQEWGQFWLDLQDFIYIVHRKVIGSSFYLNGEAGRSDAGDLLKALKRPVGYPTQSLARRHKRRGARGRCPAGLALDYAPGTLELARSAWRRPAKTAACRMPHRLDHLVGACAALGVFPSTRILQQLRGRPSGDNCCSRSISAQLLNQNHASADI